MYHNNGKVGVALRESEQDGGGIAHEMSCVTLHESQDESERDGGGIVH